jgi:cyanophycinase
MKIKYSMLQFVKRFLFFVLMLLFNQVTMAQQEIFPYKGKLIIIGGGDILDTMYNLFAKEIGGKDQPIVYIPTATDDEPWIQEGQHLVKFTSRGFTNLTTVHTRDKQKANDPLFIDRIRKAKGVFIGGGDQANIANAFLGTEVHKELIALLNRGGIIMGTSAGATIMGDLMITGYEQRKAPHIKHQYPSGLAFMKNTSIDQHVLVRNRQFDLVPMLEGNTHILGMAIDEATAAYVQRDSIQVIGRSYMMIYDQQDWNNQKKEWGKVFRPFMMYSEGEVYRFKK